ISDGQRGLAIMSHPGNPVVNRGAKKIESGNENHELGDSAERSSPFWILRRKNSMQNVAYPGRKPVSLSTKTPMRLRYRLVIHDGAVPSGSLQQIYERYAGEK
ncbi:MAG: PmoA family protein, partial [Rubripirellula sp.]|nr:PmoA family protein [Rubripirellula sp.]